VNVRCRRRADLADLDDVADHSATGGEDVRLTAAVGVTNDRLVRGSGRHLCSTIERAVGERPTVGGAGAADSSQACGNDDTEASNANRNL